MSGQQSSQASETRPVRDWFLAAFETEGPVSAGLDAVVAELSSKIDFTRALAARLTVPGQTLDAVTELGQRVRSLENTLRFRLPLLQVDRPGAWFRPPLARTTGPFSSPVLMEAVIAPVQPADVGRVRECLQKAWSQKSSRMGHAALDGAPNLWRTLLHLSKSLEDLCVLPAPFSPSRLDELPDGLPENLESRPLRAFLVNVRSEILSVRGRITECHRILNEATDRLLTAIAESARASQAEPAPSESVHSGSVHSGSAQAGHSNSSRKSASARQNTWRQNADEVREEMRRRRQERVQQNLRTPQDLSALDFMGFDHWPDQKILRQRYLSLAKTMHPDRPGGNDEKFKMLNKSYEHLASRLSQANR